MLKDWLFAGSPPHGVQIAALVVWLVFEKWLPQTNALRANSTLEVIGNALKLFKLDQVPLVKLAVSWLASPDGPQLQIVKDFKNENN